MTKNNTDDTELSEAQKAEKEKADADFELTLDGLSDDEKETKRGEREAQLLDKEYEAEEQAEVERKRLAKEAFDKRELARKGKTGGDGQGAGTPLTEERLTEILDTRDSTPSETKALEIARKHTTSEAAARAAVTFYQTRVQKTDNLEDDVLFAIGGMERKRTAGKTAELGRALNAKGRVGNDSTETQRDGDGGSKAPKLADNSPLKSYTYQGNGIYSKKLASGKTTFVNSRAMPGQRRSWVE